MGGRTGVRVLPYLDDFLFIFCSKEQAGAGSEWIRAVPDSLGLTANPKKCEWEPSQSVYHLGITVNTAAGVFEVPLILVCLLFPFLFSGVTRNGSSMRLQK